MPERGALIDWIHPLLLPGLGMTAFDLSESPSKGRDIGSRVLILLVVNDPFVLS